MKLVQNERASGLRFYPEEPGKRENAFATINKSMVKDADKIDKQVNVRWDRMVFFGTMANVAKALYDKGVTLFEPDEGKLRPNFFKTDEGDTIESYDIVCVSLKGKEAAKVAQELAKAAPAEIPA